MVDRVSQNNPNILAFVSDIMAAMRIKSAAEKLGYQISFVEHLSQIASETGMGTPQTEPTTGQEAVLFDQLTRLSPVLIIFDLANREIPWKRLVSMLKSSPATRRLPIVCYGPHVNVDDLEAARQLSAELVVSRSRFFSALPAIIKKQARSEDYQETGKSCLGELSPSAEIGLAAFNEGQYFKAHEHLEDAWNDDRTAARDFYRAVIQVAVAYLQIERSNYRGAFKMLLRARQWFRPLPEQCRGVDVKSLRDDADAVYESLARLGPERIDEFDRSLFRPIRFVS
jgi:predicted metal-dependent hydrolase